MDIKRKERTMTYKIGSPVFAADWAIYRHSRRP